MPLAAYLPIEIVYKFHEVAETWILRRYAPGVNAATGAERTRPPLFSEAPIAIFRDRSTSGTQQGDAGQGASKTCVVYTRTRLYTTDEDAGGEQAADVLFDANPASKSPGAAWQATSTGDWDEARGYAVTLTRAGMRGRPPWA